MRAKSSGVQPVSKVFGAPPKKVRREHGNGIRPGLFYAAFAVLFGTNVLTLVGFLMAPDISALLSGQSDVVVSAYEDRIAQLRVEVDRLHSRQFAQAGDINLQLQPSRCLALRPSRQVALPVDAVREALPAAA